MPKSTALSDSPPKRFAIENFEWLEPFQPSLLWRGGTLQTLSIKSLRPELDTNTYEGCESFDVEGDQTPPDVMSGYYLPTPDETDRPTVILLHGMGGHARSGYMRSMAERLIAAGYPVILWNNRGAGSSARNCRRFHHPGYTDDLNRLVDYVRGERGTWSQNGLNVIAFSLGANVLLRYLAERGADSPITAAASVSAPLDMEITSKNLRRGLNRLFDRYLLKKQRDELLRDGAELTGDERKAINDARSVWELDDTFTAPHLGYDDASEFYRENSAIYVLDKIRTPTLLFHASDDPVVDDEVFEQREWSADGPLFPALAESGGHTGFLDKNGNRWHERASVRFFDCMCDRS
ncbi:YheT family hydrolase [Aporhodopirellula aestuarii]|uniref:Alpha/beta fold hydrolase n=1 Tax=Aporhodopirellula aestuarii TaxID=2950107 RepID=A0ABT0UBK8_9BACT|nr:alpha/beta fold hydrolase [Aporhodopirellula aestuarii]MCM2374377.1 alpha/beta fold hydrolase [Aporhodopirellula aestuarii]